MHLEIPRKAPLVARLVLLTGIVVSARMANAAVAADEVIYSPIVEQGEFELESRAYLREDNDPEKEREEEYRVSAEYAPTDFWSFELEPIFVRAPGKSLRLAQLQFEHVFQFTRENAHWANVGLFVDYEYATEGDAASAIVLGPLLEKPYGHLLTTLNLFVEREIGPNRNDTAELAYGWRFQWQLRPWAAPAIQGFGDREFGEDEMDDEENTDGSAFFGQGDRIGPALLGDLRFAEEQTLHYEAGILFGITGESTDRTLRFALEYAF